ncbi:transcriptional regulator [Maritalea mediterranea]|uniref:Transcriptional regulator n=1 Tax=Maritalea mediterranea TaxID=2909667 RepID=A0ABS9E330_9HYPH|nr:transcriptional regulator [Maritalea mediterranea]MCF4097285.1 transcriptional regulator [Maritalea mediterranea]
MTPDFTPPELDQLLHQPTRTRIVAYLAARQEASFSELKRVLQLSDGNLKSHLQKLENAAYLQSHQLGGDGRPQSIYRLSKKGHAALVDYVKQLQVLMPTADLASEQHLSRPLAPKPTN